MYCSKFGDVELEHQIKTVKANIAKMMKPAKAKLGPEEIKAQAEILKKRKEYLADLQKEVDHRKKVRASNDEKCEDPKHGHSTSPPTEAKPTEPAQA